MTEVRKQQLVFTNFVLKRWLYEIGSTRRLVILRKLKNDLQSLGLSREDLRKGLLQLSTQPRIILTKLRNIRCPKGEDGDKSAQLHKAAHNRQTNIPFLEDKLQDVEHLKNPNSQAKEENRKVKVTNISEPVSEISVRHIKHFGGTKCGCDSNVDSKESNDSKNLKYATCAARMSKKSVNLSKKEKISLTNIHSPLDANLIQEEERFYKMQTPKQISNPPKNTAASNQFHKHSKLNAVPGRKPNIIESTPEICTKKNSMNELSSNRPNLQNINIVSNEAVSNYNTREISKDNYNTFEKNSPKCCSNKNISRLHDCPELISDKVATDDIPNIPLRSNRNQIKINLSAHKECNTYAPKTKQQGYMSEKGHLHFSHVSENNKSVESDKNFTVETKTFVVQEEHKIEISRQTVLTFNCHEAEAGTEKNKRISKDIMPIEAVKRRKICVTISDIDKSTAERKMKRIKVKLRKTFGEHTTLSEGEEEENLLLSKTQERRKKTPRVSCDSGLYIEDDLTSSTCPITTETMHEIASSTINGNSNTSFQCIERVNEPHLNKHNHSLTFDTCVINATEPSHEIQTQGNSDASKHKLVINISKITEKDIDRGKCTGTTQDCNVIPNIPQLLENHLTIDYTSDVNSSDIVSHDRTPRDNTNSISKIEKTNDVCLPTSNHKETITATNKLSKFEFNTADTTITELKTSTVNGNNPLLESNAVFVAPQAALALSSLRKENVEKEIVIVKAKVLVDNIGFPSLDTTYAEQREETFANCNSRNENIVASPAGFCGEVIRKTFENDLRTEISSIDSSTVSDKSLYESDTSNDNSTKDFCNIPLNEQNVQPTRVLQPKLRVRSSAELGSRWCPTPVNSTTLTSVNSSNNISVSQPALGELHIHDFPNYNMSIYKIIRISSCIKCIRYLNKKHLNDYKISDQTVRDTQLAQNQLEYRNIIIELYNQLRNLKVIAKFHNNTDKEYINFVTALLNVDLLKTDPTSNNELVTFVLEYFKFFPNITNNKQTVSPTPTMHIPVSHEGNQQIEQTIPLQTSIIARPTSSSTNQQHTICNMSNNQLSGTCMQFNSLPQGQNLQRNVSTISHSRTSAEVTTTLKYTNLQSAQYEHGIINKNDRQFVNQRHTITTTNKSSMEESNLSRHADTSMHYMQPAHYILQKNDSVEPLNSQCVMNQRTPSGIVESSSMTTNVVEYMSHPIESNMCCNKLPQSDQPTIPKNSSQLQSLLDNRDKNLNRINTSRVLLQNTIQSNSFQTQQQSVPSTPTMNIQNTVQYLPQKLSTHNAVQHTPCNVLEKPVLQNDVQQKDTYQRVHTSGNGMCIVVLAPKNYEDITVLDHTSYNSGTVTQKLNMTTLQKKMLYDQLNFHLESVKVMPKFVTPAQWQTIKQQLRMAMNVQQQLRKELCSLGVLNRQWEPKQQSRVAASTAQKTKPPKVRSENTKQKLTNIQEGQRVLSQVQSQILDNQRKKHHAQEPLNNIHNVSSENENLPLHQNLIYTSALSQKKHITSIQQSQNQQDSIPSSRKYPNKGEVLGKQLNRTQQVTLQDEITGKEKSSDTISLCTYTPEALQNKESTICTGIFCFNGIEERNVTSSKAVPQVCGDTSQRESSECKEDRNELDTPSAEKLLSKVATMKIIDKDKPISKCQLVENTLAHTENLSFSDKDTTQCSGTVIEETKDSTILLINELGITISDHQHSEDMCEVKQAHTENLCTGTNKGRSSVIISPQSNKDTIVQTTDKQDIISSRHHPSEDICKVVQAETEQFICTDANVTHSSEAFCKKSEPTLLDIIDQKIVEILNQSVCKLSKDNPKIEKVHLENLSYTGADSRNSSADAIDSTDSCILRDMPILNIIDVRSISPNTFDKMQHEMSSRFSSETINLEDSINSNSDSNEIEIISDEDDDEEDVKICLYCTKKSTVLCSSCLEAHYCSKQCQELHWKVHYKTCKLHPLLVKTNCDDASCKDQIVRPASA